jgi:aminocarboxymuconate-semialdehyde decarboxylase
MNRLWFDAHVEGDAALRMLIDVVGTERLVFGTNFGGWDTPSALDPVAASLTANARRLMRLPD